MRMFLAWIVWGGAVLGIEPPASPDLSGLIFIITLLACWLVVWLRISYAKYQGENGR